MTPQYVHKQSTTGTKKDAIKDIPEYPRAPQFLAKWNWQHQARSAKTQDKGFPRDIGWKLRGERHLSRTADPRTTSQKKTNNYHQIKQQEISSKHTPTKSTNYKITEYKWTATTFITLFREIEWYPNLHIAVSYEIIHESLELKPNYLDKTEHN